MKISVTDWTRTVVLGGAVVVSLAVASPRPVVTLTLDLIGDGVAGVTIRGDDLRPVRGVALVAERVGIFRVQASATTAVGCTDTTTAVRRVEVSR